ncbi:hypothetical protein DFJ73DRAFT_47269 [Zopfochytrium polystomum]|nr:hypothetical protein DFJ73DRAFT_47269 [Zopfochytrium polystomum]
MIPSVIKVSVGDGRFVTEYPTVLASVQCEHFPAKLLDQYRSDFLKWMWTDDLVSLVGSWSSGNGQAPLLMGLDISGCFDASRRSIELSLVDGGATEVLLESRKKEAEEKARKEAEEAKRLQEIATAQAAVSLLPEEPAPLPSAVPETKQSFSNYSMMLPSDDPFSDLSLNMGDGSDMVDLDLAVIDDSDFDVFVGTGSGTTPVTNGFSAVSPALPAGTSPSPFTFPATPAQQPFATVSPAPFTPAPYATPSHIASNGMSPPPATPCPPTSSIGDDTLLFQSNCSVPSKPENDPTPAAISVTRPPFEVKIFEESGEPLAANSLMPERWRSILIDYNLVWESKASSDRRKYGPGGQFSYSPNLGLKRTLGERARERKRPRYNDGPAVGEKVEESSESEDETSLSEASDISTDTGRQVAGAQAFAPIFISPLSIGAASSMSEDLMGRADSSSLLPFLVIPKDSGVESQEDPSLSTPQNEVAFELDELVISLLVDGYALGREHRWLHFNHRSSETPSLDYHPLFQYAVLCRLSSLFSHIFSTKSVNGNTQERDSGLGIKNMLNVQQFFDAHVDKSMSKYGRFQIRKKRRPTEQILEPLEAPSIILYHDSHLVSLSTASIRFWDKLRIAPRGGMKDIDFMMLCPHNPDIADSLRYWCSEFRTVWDAGNFGQCTPYISLKPGDDGLFYMSAEGAAGGEDNRLVSKYKEALAILARHLSQSMVETTQSNSKQSSHVIFIPNCFPHRPQSHLEMTTLSAEFLRSIAEMSHCELDDVLSRVVPVVLPLDLLLSFSACRELGKAFQMRDFCFGIYARCRKPTPAGTGGGRLFTPTYTLSYEASSNPTQLLSVKRPVDYAMSSILEPDRVIHLAYFVRWTNGRWWIGAS